MAHTKNPSGNEDRNKTRCVRCGFWCDLSRDKIVSGTGIRNEAISHTASTAPDDPVTGYGGCPQCGAGDYTRRWR